MRGCCSRYEECSDKKMCIYASDPDYTDCGYRKNLEAGRIFYGVNAGAAASVELPKPSDKLSEFKEDRKDSSIFLHCFNRLFAIKSSDKELSRKLSSEQAEKIETAFVDAGIPYKLQIDSLSQCIIDYPTEEDLTPANSRVVFEIEGERYHLLNYNSWLIKRRTAERIQKAFDNHFIPAKVELRGQYANNEKVTVQNVNVKIDVQVIDRRPAQKHDTKIPGKGLQVSMFDIVSTTSPESAKVIPMPCSISADFPLGSIVTAKDEYWGTYRGVLVDIYYMVLSRDTKMAKVRILENLVYPRQDAILQQAPCSRASYAVDSIQVFYLSNCKIEEAQNASLSATG